jgi:hypothetical protein
MQHQMDDYGMEMDEDHQIYGEEDMMGEGSEAD